MWPLLYPWFINEKCVAFSLMSVILVFYWFTPTKSSCCYVNDDNDDWSSSGWRKTNTKQLLSNIEPSIVCFLYFIQLQKLWKYMETGVSYSLLGWRFVNLLHSNESYFVAERTYSYHIFGVLSILINATAFLVKMSQPNFHLWRLYTWLALVTI